jgi:protein gp37
MSQSKIEWTESTWNPVTGCTKISEGCRNCYAERMARRLQAMGQKSYRNGFELTCHPELLGLPLRWKKPQIVFVNSMSDLFHEQIAEDFIYSIVETMRLASHHLFQVLTKRTERLAELAPELNMPHNVWIGVTVESSKHTDRIDHLRSTDAHIKFLSLEPLLDDVAELDLTGIDWVIVGGESGPGARPMDPDWARNVRDQCVSQNIPFFFKQWGGVNKKKAGRILDGQIWDQMPSVEHLCLSS